MKNTDATTKPWDDICDMWLEMEGGGLERSSGIGRALLRMPWTLPVREKRSCERWAWGAPA